MVSSISASSSIHDSSVINSEVSDDIDTDITQAFDIDDTNSNNIDDDVEYDAHGWPIENKSNNTKDAEKEDDDWTKGVTYNGDEINICDYIDNKNTSENTMIPFSQHASPRFVDDGTVPSTAAAAAAAAAIPIPMSPQQHLLYQRCRQQQQQQQQHYQHQQNQQQQQHQYQYQYQHQYQHPRYEQQQY
jgi:hypothetical protein